MAKTVMGGVKPVSRKKQQVVSQDVFNYKLLRKDLKVWCRDNGTNLQTLSQDVFFRSWNYLSIGLCNGNLPLNVLMKLTEHIGAEMKTYEIKAEPEPEPVEQEPVTETQPPENAMSGKGWEMAVMVNEEFGSVAVKITLDGEEVAIGRSYLCGKDITGVVQSISYASHMCYKLVQQKKIAENGYKKAEEDAAQRDEPAQTAPPDQGPMLPNSNRVVFKDWVKKYEQANSTYGKFARYVASHYIHFPSTGEKDMRYYLRLNSGTAHIDTFSVLFAMYKNQNRAQFVEESKLAALKNPL